MYAYKITCMLYDSMICFPDYIIIICTSCCTRIMRDFQTWLITQVMVARGAACQVISELPVCPGYTVYTSQAAEQDNKTHLTWPNISCAYCI